MDEREELQKSLDELERQRQTLGEAVVEPAIAALREKIAALEEAPLPPDQRRILATVVCAQ